MANYKPVEEGQGYFLHVNPSEHFDDNSLEKVINNFVDGYVDIDSFSKKYKNDKVGQKAIHPKVKLKVIFYAFANGIQSSRVMEKMLRMNHIGFIYLSGNRQLDYSTICKFINDFSDEIKSIFSKLLLLMEELGLIDWSKIIIDGTKISSSANEELTSNAQGFKKKLMRYKKLSDKLIERTKYMDKLEEQGKIDKNTIKNEKRKIKVQRKKYSNIIEKIKQYERDVEEERIDPKEKINLTDRDSRLFYDKKKCIQGFNVQAAYSNNDILIDIEATDSSSDIPLLETMVNRVEKIKEQNGIYEDSKYLNDKGYFNPSQMKNLMQSGKDIYVAIPKSFEQNWFINGEHKIEKRDDGIYFICKDNREHKGYYNKKEEKFVFDVTKKFCKDCINHDMCWKNAKEDSNKRRFSIIKTYVDDKEMWLNYKNKMESLEGKMIYNKRIGKEHNFHDIKEHYGLNRIERRGKEKSNIIAVISGIVHNLKKMNKLLEYNSNNRLFMSKMLYQT